MPKKSLPSLGAWIETSSPASNPSTPSSLPSLGAWIETGLRSALINAYPCRSLHWERGLKQDRRPLVRSQRLKSLPSLGAWIETRRTRLRSARRTASLPSLGAWIETHVLGEISPSARSLPSLGAWIETIHLYSASPWCDVAPFIGSVD